MMQSHEAKSAWDWLLCMLLEGWDAFPSGDGAFLYLHRDGAYYRGPVVTDARFVHIYNCHEFHRDLEHLRATA
jgi:hypothetical protein